MRKLVVLTALALLPLFAVVGSSAVASHRGDRGGLTARLSGFQEVPAVSTTGSGRFRATVDNDSIDFRLTYGNLTSAVSAAHIHFGQKSVDGGVIAFLCGGGGKAGCPPSGTITGTITATDVIGPAEQGITSGEFAEVVRALRAGVTYVNVHTSNFVDGEIRGQIDHAKHFRGKHNGRGGDDNGRDDKGRDDNHRGGGDDDDDDD
jgi:hypothetical protein